MTKLKSPNLYKRINSIMDSIRGAFSYASFEKFQEFEKNDIKYNLCEKISFKNTSISFLYIFNLKDKQLHIHEQSLTLLLEQNINGIVTEKFSCPMDINDSKTNLIKFINLYYESLRVQESNNDYNGLKNEPLQLIQTQLLFECFDPLTVYDNPCELIKSLSSEISDFNFLKFSFESNRDELSQAKDKCKSKQKSLNLDYDKKIDKLYEEIKNLKEDKRKMNQKIEDNHNISTLTNQFEDIADKTQRSKKELLFRLNSLMLKGDFNFKIHDFIEIAL